MCVREGGSGWRLASSVGFVKAALGKGRHPPAGVALHGALKLQIEQHRGDIFGAQPGLADQLIDLHRSRREQRQHLGARGFRGPLGE